MEKHAALRVPVQCPATRGYAAAVRRGEASLPVNRKVRLRSTDFFYRVTRTAFFSYLVEPADVSSTVHLTA